MAKSTVEIEFTAQDAQLARVFQKTERGLDQIARRLDKVETASKKSTDVSSKGFEKVTGAITRTAAAIIGA